MAGESDCAEANMHSLVFDVEIGVDNEVLMRVAAARAGGRRSCVVGKVRIVSQRCSRARRDVETLTGIISGPRVGSSAALSNYLPTESVQSTVERPRVRCFFTKRSTCRSKQNG